MIKKIFTIYDEKSMAYLTPFFMDTVGQATRAMSDLCNDPEHSFCKHTADYTLFQLGEYDDITSSIKYEKHSLGSLLEYKTINQAQNDNITSIGGTDK